MSDNTVTKFKGPGQWRSQAARLERGTPAQLVKRLAEKAKDAR